MCDTHDNTATWQTKSGSNYTSRIQPLTEPVPFGAGTFIIAKPTETGGWSPLIMGQTSNVSETVSSAAIMVASHLLEATHLHVLMGSESHPEFARQLILKDLVDEHNPLTAEGLTATS